jgi:hypothetical protein
MAPVEGFWFMPTCKRDCPPGQAAAHKTLRLTVQSAFGLKKGGLPITIQPTMESKPFETRDLPAMARERVQIGPVASWIDPCYYDQHFSPKIRGQLTYLLFEKQIHAELGQTYVHVAMRLESQQAVQHQSQWRIGLEPQTQSIVLHSIKIRRGENETEHASLDRMQFLQREAGLERFTLQGSVTLLLLLEDVRPGDILEYSFTVSDRPRLMPEYVTAFWTLPMGTEIGKYRFLIRYAERRAMKWKTSAEKLVPKITTENGEVCCYWMDANFVSPDPEGAVPIWHVMFPWIQVSDCPDWQTMARAVLEAWEKQLPGEGVAKMVEEVVNLSPDPLARIARAIELVQDGFRYLSVNVEAGGYIPAPPEAVVRRRYGDCKDLTFLLVQLLRGLGVPARPVLVDSFLRKSVGSMLPSLQMFNHVVVEYEIGTEKRWIDCTAKNQGGGALNRYITDFGVGLLIDAATTTLAPVPKGSLASGTCDIRESFVFDTTGKPSYLSIVISATGPAADALRNDFANAGMDGMAKDRLQGCANRFNRASRIKPLEYRDDRDANEFVLAEAFEIQHTLLTHEPSRTCLFQVRGDLTAGLLANPGLAVRRHPLMLPYPCHRTHTVELDFAGLNSISVPLFQVGNQYFTFTRRSRTWPNLLKVTFALETLTDSIPAEKLAEHRKNVEAIHEAAIVNLQLPSGYSRHRPRWDFGALPPPNPSRAAAAGNLVVSTQKPLSPVEGPITTAEKETIALEKTAALAGMPATVKAMPPAREAIPSHAPPEKNRPTHRRSHRTNRGKMEKRSELSFYFFGAAFVLTLIGALVARASRVLGGSLVLLAILFWVWSLALASLGWKDLVKYPGTYMGSKVLATLTLVFGGILSLVYVPATFFGLRDAIMAHAGVRAESQQSDSSVEPLGFKDEHFIFHPPGDPWQQVSAREFGSNTTVGFRRPDPMCFTIIAKKIGFMYLEPRKGMVESSKTSLRRIASSYNVVSEQEVAYNGLSGWQIETEAALQGRKTYFVQWIVVTNGFGYLLTTWAPVSAKSQLKDEAGRLCADFKPTPPERAATDTVNP